LSVYFPLLFVLMAFFFLYVGIKVITSNKPLLMSSKVFFVFMLVAISPQFITSIERLSSSENAGLVFYIMPLMFLALLGFFWVQMRGVIAIGIFDDSFRDALHYSLNENKIKFEEQLSIIKLIEIDAQIQVAIQSWVGTGQLKLKESNDKRLLTKLVGGVNDYYESNSVKVNNTTSIFYIVMGVFMLIFSVSSFYLLFH